MTEQIQTQLAETDPAQESLRDMANAADFALSNAEKWTFDDPDVIGGTMRAEGDFHDAYSDQLFRVSGISEEDGSRQFSIQTLPGDKAGQKRENLKNYHLKMDGSGEVKRVGARGRNDNDPDQHAATAFSLQGAAEIDAKKYDKAFNRATRTDAELQKVTERKNKVLAAAGGLALAAGIYTGVNALMGGGESATEYTPSGIELGTPSYDINGLSNDQALHPGAVSIDNNEYGGDGSYNPDAPVHTGNQDIEPPTVSTDQASDEHPAVGTVQRLHIPEVERPPVVHHDRSNDYVAPDF